MRGQGGERAGTGAGRDGSGQPPAAGETGDCSSAAPHPLFCPSRPPFPAPGSPDTGTGTTRRRGHPPGAPGGEGGGGIHQAGHGVLGARHPFLIVPSPRGSPSGSRRGGWRSGGWRSCQDGQMLLQVVFLRSVRGRDGTFASFSPGGKGQEGWPLP